MANLSRLILIAVCCTAIAVPLIRQKLKVPLYLDALQNGVILEATRRNTSPLFKNTKILLVNYSEQGAKGVVLNQSIESGLARIQEATEYQSAGEKSLQKVIAANADVANFFWGGPVASLSLYQVSYEPGRNAVTMSDTRNIVGRGNDVIVANFAGFSGWAASQLESEISRGDWQVYQVKPDKLVRWLAANK